MLKKTQPKVKQNISQEKKEKNNVLNTLNSGPAEWAAAHQLGSFEDPCTTVFSYSISVT